MLNALHNQQDLGWATVNHPFHPLRNQRFRVLKLRKVAGEDTLILQGSYRGTFAVPREWTDQADPAPGDYAAGGPGFLCPYCLLRLRDIIDRIGNDGVDT